MEDRQWEEVKATVNLLFDNYLLRLSEFILALTESDLQICCFLKLGIAHVDIAVLLGISSASVSKRKQRLKDKIVQKTGAWGKEQTLELWLWEF